MGDYDEHDHAGDRRGHEKRSTEIAPRSHCRPSLAVNNTTLVNTSGATFTSDRKENLSIYNRKSNLCLMLKLVRLNYLMFG